jgi:hypothetical protein
VPSTSAPCPQKSLASLSNSAALLLPLLAASCSLVTTFDLSRAVETSDALCSDGIDNDGNGLTDCQDWGCLDTRVCCTRPVVVLTDDFAGPSCASQSCDSPAACAPDPALWSSWGTPLPLLCEDALLPHKAQQCYAVGVVGQTALALHPGLVVKAHLVGRPEAVGGLELGLTLKSAVVSGSNACGTVDGPAPIVSIHQAGTASGYRLQAFLDGVLVGTSAEVGADAPHEAGFSIGADRTVSYTVDGAPFAVSDNTQPLPQSAPSVHVVLDGVGLAARFADVTVTDGTQCDSPGSWAASTPFVALAPSSEAYAWDGEGVSNPAIVSAATGDLVMYYTGCAPTIGGGGCSSSLGFGRAVSSAGAPFQRDAKPRLTPTASNSLDVVLPAQALAGVGDAVRGYFDVSFGSKDWNFAPFVDVPTDPSITVAKPLDDTTLVRTTGSWDEDVCCATVMDRPGKRMLWYAGKTAGDTVWHIGLAASTDGGVHFTRVGSAPVFSGGAREDYDGRGVSMPVVLYDESRQLYRMWYTATALFGVTSIGYAVSVDGIDWHKFPANPVITAGGVGLESLGRAAIIEQQGRTVMWIDGVDPEKRGSEIFQLQNEGQPAR